MPSSWGAYDFITKPFDRETLRRVVSKALERNRLVRENLDASSGDFAAGNRVGGFVGVSAAR
jgi:DNA-binding NtrC family response regulator